MKKQHINQYLRFSSESSDKQRNERAKRAEKRQSAQQKNSLCFNGERSKKRSNSPSSSADNNTMDFLEEKTDDVSHLSSHETNSSASTPLKSNQNYHNKEDLDISVIAAEVSSCDHLSSSIINKDLHLNAIITEGEYSHDVISDTNTPSTIMDVNVINDSTFHSATSGGTLSIILNESTTTGEELTANTSNISTDANLSQVPLLKKTLKQNGSIQAIADQIKIDISSGESYEKVFNKGRFENVRSFLRSCYNKRLSSSCKFFMNRKLLISVAVTVVLISIFSALIVLLLRKEKDNVVSLIEFLGRNAKLEAFHLNREGNNTVKNESSVYFSLHNQIIVENLTSTSVPTIQQSTTPKSLAKVSSSTVKEFAVASMMLRRTSVQLNVSNVQEEEEFLNNISVINTTESSESFSSNKSTITDLDALVNHNAVSASNNDDWTDYSSSDIRPPIRMTEKKEEAFLQPSINVTTSNLPVNKSDPPTTPHPPWMDAAGGWWQRAGY